MRATIEITDAQHRQLRAIARHRSLRGYSILIQEALDAYLPAVGSDEVDALPSLEGVLTEAEVAEVRSQIG